MSEDEASVDNKLDEEAISAVFYCDICGGVASTVHYLGPGVKDPRFTPEPAGLPPGVGGIGQQSPRVSIEGGPVSVTISVAGEWTEAAVAALREEDAKKLRRVDSEFAPFWCFRCEKSYCDSHWISGDRYDDGFFDCTEGTCPEGHRQTLMD